MKKILFAAILLLFIFCQKDTSPTSPSAVGTNLIKNASFELDGNATIKYWEVKNGNGVRLVEDAPPGGGAFAVQVDADWFPLDLQPHLLTRVYSPGSYVFKLSFWGKYSRFVAGGAAIRIKRPDTTFQDCYLNVRDTSWTYYSILDTIHTQPSDSIIIALFGGFTHLPAGSTSFDLIKFEVVNIVK